MLLGYDCFFLCTWTSNNVNRLCFDFFLLLNGNRNWCRHGVSLNFLVGVNMYYSHIQSYQFMSKAGSIQFRGGEIKGSEPQIRFLLPKNISQPRPTFSSVHKFLKLVFQNSDWRKYKTSLPKKIREGTSISDIHSPVTPRFMDLCHSGKWYK
jgi:hypothetical protein